MVPRDAITHALLQKGINLMDIQAVDSLYRHTTYQFTINQGVAQGCPLSPTLFAIFIDDLLKTLNSSSEGIQIGNTNINNLAYADDIVLLANSKENLQTLINKTAGWCKENGMLANISKCATMSNLASYEHLYWEDTPIPKKKTYKYLGLLFQSNGQWDKQKKTPIGKCHSKISKYNRILGNSNPDINTKIQIYKGRGEISARVWYRNLEPQHVARWTGRRAIMRTRKNGKHRRMSR